MVASYVGGDIVAGILGRGLQREPLLSIWTSEPMERLSLK